MNDRTMSPVWCTRMLYDDSIYTLGERELSCTLNAPTESRGVERGRLEFLFPQGKIPARRRGLIERSRKWYLHSAWYNRWFQDGAIARSGSAISITLPISIVIHESLENASVTLDTRLIDVAIISDYYALAKIFIYSILVIMFEENWRTKVSEIYRICAPLNLLICSHFRGWQPIIIEGGNYGVL